MVWTVSDPDSIPELFWNPGDLLQCEDRAHRIGRTRPVRVIYLLARETIDQIIWPLLKRKMDIVRQAVDGVQAGQWGDMGVTMGMKDLMDEAEQDLAREEAAAAEELKKIREEMEEDA